MAAGSYSTNQSGTTIHWESGICTEAFLVLRTSANADIPGFGQMPTDLRNEVIPLLIQMTPRAFHHNQGTKRYSQPVHK